MRGRRGAEANYYYDNQYLQGPSHAASTRCRRGTAAAGAGRGLRKRERARGRERARAARARVRAAAATRETRAGWAASARPAPRAAPPGPAASGCRPPAGPR